MILNINGKQVVNGVKTVLTEEMLTDHLSDLIPNAT